MSRHSYSRSGDINKTPLRCLVSSKQCRLQVLSTYLTTYSIKYRLALPSIRQELGWVEYYGQELGLAAKFKSNIRLVIAFPGMMSCRDDLDGGALVLAGSRDDHWGPTSSNHLSILRFSSPLLKVLIYIITLSFHFFERPGGHLRSSIRLSIFRLPSLLAICLFFRLHGRPYLKYGLLASGTFEFVILWIKSSSFSSKCS